MANSTLKTYTILVDLAGKANSLAMQLRDELISKADAEKQAIELIDQKKKDLK